MPLVPAHSQESGTAFPPRVEYLAFLTKGLRAIAEDEIRARLGPSVAVEETRSKIIRVSMSAHPKRWGRIRTVDDVAVAVTPVRGVDDPHDLEQLVREADLDRVYGVVGRVGRELEQTFSVTATVARSPVGSSTAVTQIVQRSGERHWGLRAVEGTRAPMDLRVFLDGTYGVLGVRLFDRPLSARPYRVASSPGALRPTVAAAMVMFTRGPLTESNRGPSRVWDPFCGSGTILCEAALLGHEVRGSDIDYDAIEAARQNLAAVSPRLAATVKVQDAFASKDWARADVDYLVSNIPWGKQVRIPSKATLNTELGRGIAQVLDHGGRVGLLMPHPEPLLAKARKAAGRELHIESLTLGLLGQSPSLVRIGPDGAR